MPTPKQMDKMASVVGGKPHASELQLQNRHIGQAAFVLYP